VAKGNITQRRFRLAGNGLIFNNSMNNEGLRIKGRTENGYEEGCTRGARLKKGDHRVPFFNLILGPARTLVSLPWTK
jgi:hypothetical protein